MKRQVKIAFTSLFCLCTVALAQPDLTDAPKGENPPNRKAGAARPAKEGKQAKQLDATLKERGAKRIEQRLVRLPKMLTALGVTDAATQSAITAHVRAMLEAREPLTDAQLTLRRALASKTTADAQIKAAMDAERAKRKDYEATFQKALDELDKKLIYTKNLRLEAALLAAGALDPYGANLAM